MKALRQRRRKEAGGEKSASRLKTGVSLAALVAAAAVFVILVQVEKSTLAQYEKGVIYVAAERIPKGQMITEENYSEYFTAKELDIQCIPRTALTAPEQVRGLAARFDVEPGVLLTEGMFEKMEDILEGMEEPVIAGFKADDIYQVAGGILRAGDRIHIYSVRDGNTVLAWEAVYVQQVFDGSGADIPNTDRTASAQRINVYLDKKDIGDFYTGLADGSLRVVKVCD